MTDSDVQIFIYLYTVEFKSRDHIENIAQTCGAQMLL